MVKSPAVRRDPLARHQSGTVLAFDYGQRKIGVAVGSTHTESASPLTTLPNTSEAARWAAIDALVGQWRPEHLVVGVAYREDGSANPVTASMLAFRDALIARHGLPVHTVDETLSTYDSKLRLEADLGIRRTQILRIHDQVAAQLILESWLRQRR